MKNPYGLSDQEMKTIEKKLEEKMEEYARKRIPVVETKYGNTYIKVEEYDHISFANMQRIWKFLSLMGLEEEIWSDSNNGFYYGIKGDDSKRAAYIQKFINDGYRLSWK